MRNSAYYLPTRFQTSVRTAAFFLILLSVGSALEAHGQMKLLAPDTGWIVYGSTLFWTHDGGAHWTDITPRAPAVPKSATFGNVFFRDTSEGWAMASFPEALHSLTPQTIAERKTSYSVMHTQNGGESWSATPLAYPALPHWIEETFAGPASLYFLDSMHGWMDIGFAGNARPGKLLATGDGGQTWNWVNSPSHSGPVLNPIRMDDIPSEVRNSLQ